MKELRERARKILQVILDTRKIEELPQHIDYLSLNHTTYCRVLIFYDRFHVAIWEVYRINSYAQQSLQRPLGGT